MPIINRIDMLSTGIRSEVGVKIYGSDLAGLEQTARAVADVLRTVPGAANVYPEPLTSSQYLNVRVDRERAARYGLTVAAVQEVIQTAIGERNLTLTLEGRRRFPVRVRDDLLGKRPATGDGPDERAGPRPWRLRRRGQGGGFVASATASRLLHRLE